MKALSLLLLLVCAMPQPVASQTGAPRTPEQLRKLESTAEGAVRLMTFAPLVMRKNGMKIVWQFTEDGKGVMTRQSLASYCPADQPDCTAGPMIVQQFEYRIFSIHDARTGQRSEEAYLCMSVQAGPVRCEYVKLGLSLTAPERYVVLDLTDRGTKTWLVGQAPYITQ